MNNKHQALLALTLYSFLTGCSEEKLADNANGKQLYEHYCADCHGESGKGKFLSGVPANAKTKLSTKEIMDLIRHDRGQVAMPIFDKMSRKDALLIASYLKSQL